MKLEIKTKCSICETELKHLTERGVHETILFTDLCPTCHPAKPEKVTPSDVWIEARDNHYHKHSLSFVMATGERTARDGKILAVFGIGFCPVSYDQWRYPGEKEWRD